MKAAARPAKVMSPELRRGQRLVDGPQLSQLYRTQPRCIIRTPGRNLTAPDQLSDGSSRAWERARATDRVAGLRQQIERLNAGARYQQIASCEPDSNVRETDRMRGYQASWDKPLQGSNPAQDLPRLGDGPLPPRARAGLPADRVKVAASRFASRVSRRPTRRPQ